MEFVTLHKSELCGSDGAFGLEIKVAATNLPDLKQDSIWRAANSASELIESAVRKAVKDNDPKTAVATENNRKVVDEVFPAPIFVEEIDNGYCGDWCCKHLPWFIVTTKIGRFTIGWRKRVISIDWQDTTGAESAIALFKDEDVTKGLRSIHAWSIEDAQRYVETIMLSA